MEEIPDLISIIVFYDDGDNTHSHTFRVNSRAQIKASFNEIFGYFGISSNANIGIYKCKNVSDITCKYLIFSVQRPHYGDLSWKQNDVGDKSKIVIRLLGRIEKVGKRITRVNSISGFNFFCALQRREDYIAPPGVPVLPINRILLVGEYHHELTNLNECSSRISEPLTHLTSDNFLKDIIVNIPEDQCLDIFLETDLPDTIPHRSRMSLISESKTTISEMSKFGAEVLHYIHDPNLRVHYVDYARHLAFYLYQLPRDSESTRTDRIHDHFKEFLLFVTNKDVDYPLYLGDGEELKAFLLEYRDMFLKEMDKCYLSKDDIISTFIHAYDEHTLLIPIS